MHVTYLFRDEPDLSRLRKEFNVAYGNDSMFTGTVNGHPTSIIKSRIESPSASYSVTYKIDGRIEGALAGYFDQVLEGLGGTKRQEPERLPMDVLAMEGQLIADHRREDPVCDAEMALDGKEKEMIFKKIDAALVKGKL